MPPIAGTLVRYKILRSYAAPASGARWSDGKTPVGALGNLVKYRPRMFRVICLSNFGALLQLNQFGLVSVSRSKDTLKSVVCPRALGEIGTLWGNACWLYIQQGCKF